MISISQDQALDRWGTLPDVLREAIVSESNSDFIWKACNDEHLPDEKIPVVTKLTGYVLLGFLHPEDVAKEIKERLGIDPKTASLVEDSLNKRVFAPLRADLDKVYAPLSKLEIASLETGIPKMLQDVESAVPTPLPINKIAPPIAPLTSPPPKPTTLSDVGWSRRSSAGPGIQLTTSAPTPGAPTEPAPMMLHQDTTFKAPKKNEDFTLSKPGANAEVHLDMISPQAPTRPAVLEFGGAAASAPKPSAPATNGTRYSEFNPSLSSAPIASAGQRNVSQIAPAVPTPKPAAAPSPIAMPIPHPPQAQQLPQTPRPPQTPPQPSQKPTVVVKDFL